MRHGEGKSNPISVRALTVGPLDCGCYLVWDEASRAAVVIDPGGDEDVIAEAVARDSLRPEWIVNTHGHGDHIGANAELKARWPALRIAIHSLDAPMLTSPFKNLSLAFGVSVRSPSADVLLEEGSVVEAGAVRLEVLHTPGHTPGSISLVLRTDPVQVFTGDLLFAGGVGRTDLMGGSAKALRASIVEKIFTLPDTAVVHPGHPPDTTVGTEKRSNPDI